MVLGWRLRKSKLSHNEQLTYLSYPWWRIYTVAAGTLIGLSLVTSLAERSNRLTQWIYDGNFLSDWLEKLLESWLGRSPCCRYCLWEQLDQLCLPRVRYWFFCALGAVNLHPWSQNPARTTKHASRNKF